VLLVSDPVRGDMIVGFVGGTVSIVTVTTALVGETIPFVSVAVSLMS
jgi:hypothetical protein